MIHIATHNYKPQKQMNTLKVQTGKSIHFPAISSFAYNFGDVVDMCKNKETYVYVGKFILGNFAAILKLQLRLY